MKNNLTFIKIMFGCSVLSVIMFSAFYIWGLGHCADFYALHAAVFLCINIFRNRLWHCTAQLHRKKRGRGTLRQKRQVQKLRAQIHHQNLRTKRKHQRKAYKYARQLRPFKKRMTFRQHIPFHKELLHLRSRCLKYGSPFLLRFWNAIWRKTRFSSEAAARRSGRLCHPA